VKRLGFITRFVFVLQEKRDRPVALISDRQVVLTVTAEVANGHRQRVVPGGESGRRVGGIKRILEVNRERVVQAVGDRDVRSPITVEIAQRDRRWPASGLQGADVVATRRGRILEEQRHRAGQAGGIRDGDIASGTFATQIANGYRGWLASRRSDGALR